MRLFNSKNISQYYCLCCILNQINIFLFQNWQCKCLKLKCKFISMLALKKEIFGACFSSASLLTFLSGALLTGCFINYLIMENVYIAHGLDTYKRYLTCNRCISMEITLSQFVVVVLVSFVGRFLDRFININPSHELLRPLPHGQTRGWVIKEHALVTRPHHTPDIYAQVNPIQRANIQKL